MYNVSTYLACTISRDQGDPATLTVGIEDVKNSNKFITFHARTNFHTDRVPDASKVLDMCSRNLSRTVSDPQEVGRGVVVALLFLRAWQRVPQFSREGFLVIKHKPFMTTPSSIKGSMRARVN